ncbi:ladderlectin-like [Denticeps clupeoides]|uniref:ladderlectin-like n=1 Tax=Denticeps clupeoides TaxID=299321 RepID=UPI0010A36D4F|nr:ladderlectin-like [Denticeps clupeoides]
MCSCVFNYQHSEALHLLPGPVSLYSRLITMAALHILLICCFTVLPIIRADCDSAFNGYSYSLINSAKDWASAERDCQSRGGNLASVQSEPEMQFMRNTFSSNVQTFWIGATDAPKEGVWLWSNGKPWGYSNWNGGEPNNSGGRENCIHVLVGLSMRWNDLPCDNVLPYLCAKKL